MTFSPPVFITIGDEYDKKNKVPVHEKPNFKVSGPKTGKDSLFQSKFIGLADGDKYVDPGVYERRRRLQDEKTKFRPSDAPFRYSNPAHKGPSGSHFGTFDEKNPPKHEVEYNVARPGDKPTPPAPVPRNFIVSHPKKGGYGYAGVTIGKGDEYKYISSPYDSERRAEAIKAKENSTKIAGPAFKAACKKSDFFDETPHGISKVYSLDKPLPAKSPLNDSKADHSLKPWVPGGRLIIDQGRYEYQEDPYEAKEKRLREERLKNKPLAQPWKPLGQSKSLPTKPIKFTPH